MYWTVTESLPRMRGDRPQLLEARQLLEAFTPHARGSTRFACSSLTSTVVYPACAGIDRELAVKPHNLNRLPRMRGDRPLPKGLRLGRYRFTPHARGSTVKRVLRNDGTLVYPACAGIDRSPEHHYLLGRGLPRMRGDRPYGGRA